MLAQVHRQHFHDLDFGPGITRRILHSLSKFSNIKFTHSSSQSEIIFLDVSMKIQDGHITTGIHIKPTNHLQYLHFTSCHPNNTKRSIPYSQAIRGKRICSTETELQNFNQTISEAF